MSEIRFIKAQGDLLDAAMADATNHEPRSAPRRLRPRPRWRSAVVAGGLALVVAGCAAAAVSLLGSGERLALGKVDCYYSDGVRIPGASGYDTLITGASLIAGETPAQLCEEEFKTNERAYVSSGMRPLTDPRVVSCRQSATSTAVFIGTGAVFVGAKTTTIGRGTSDPCQQLGLTPLPDSFPAATASVEALATQLRSLYLSRDCWLPSEFASRVRSTLVNAGFTNWRVVLPKSTTQGNGSPFDTVGHCAGFVSFGPRSGASFQSLDGSNRTVDLTLNNPRSVQSSINRADTTLSADTRSNCYGRASIRALVDRTFAGSGMTPKIAVTTNPNGGIGTFSFGTAAANHHFDRGCPLLFLSTPSSDDHVVYVWLIARHGTPIKPLTGASFGPPATDFN